MLRLTETNNLNDPRFLSLYRTSFPPDEQIPPSQLSNLIGRGGRLLLAFDSDVFVGFAFTFEQNGLLYIAYLAVVPAFRGEGYGSDILDSLVTAGRYQGCILTIERSDIDDEDGLKASRRRFYERNGWKKTPLRLLSKGTDLDVYSLDSDLTEDEVLGMIGSFYGGLR